MSVAPQFKSAQRGQEEAQRVEPLSPQSSRAFLRGTAMGRTRRAVFLGRDERAQRGEAAGGGFDVPGRARACEQRFPIGQRRADEGAVGVGLGGRGLHAALQFARGGWSLACAFPHSPLEPVAQFGGGHALERALADLFRQHQRHRAAAALFIKHGRRAEFVEAAGRGRGQAAVFQRPQKVHPPARRRRGRP